MDAFVEQLLLSNLIQSNLKVQKAFKNFSSNIDLAALETAAQAKFETIKQTALDLLKTEGEDAPVNIYIDGCFDLIHAGHYNAIR